MAIYIPITKLSDGASSAEYAFGTSGECPGKLKLDKRTGEVSLIEAASGDVRGAVYARAAHKIKKHWSSGELPQSTCWAA